MSCKKYKVTFSTIIESDTPDNAIDDLCYNINFILSEYMIDKCVEINKDIESIFDLEEYN